MAKKKTASKKATVMRGAKRTRKPSAHSNAEGVWVWNSAVHEKFGEALYYFLVAVKPFERPEWDKEVRALMSRFGVSKFCSYQLFGSFDALLRLWLPPSESGRFKTEAAKIANVRSVLELHVRVSDKRLCWVADEAKAANNKIEGIHAEVLHLAGDEILRAQAETGSQRPICEELRRKGLIFERKAELNVGQMKAFLSFSAPDATTNNKIKDMILERLEELLKEEEYEFSQPPTMMVGVGFCWVLVKVVARNYVALGKFVNVVNEKFGPYGMSSNTFLVFGDPPAIEGDSVSSLALGTSSGVNTTVAQFLPSLYDVDMLKEAKGGFEDFVLTELIPPFQDSPPDEAKGRDQLIEFLDAAVREDRDAAFLSLYPVVRAAESQLREPLGHVCGLVDYPGGVPALLDFLKQKKDKPPRSLKELTLRDSMQAGRELLRYALPSDPWVENGVSDKDFEKIAEVRNTVMHDKELNLRQDWRKYATLVLRLFDIRKNLLQRYKDICEN